MLDNIFDEIWAKKFVFLGTFFLVFTISYIALVALDYLPEEPTSGEDSEESAPSLADTTKTTVSQEENNLTETTNVVVGDDDSHFKPEVTVTDGASLPISIYIEKLDKAVSVLNPDSRSIADLDAALLEGVVRHPDSATLTQEGNVFLLGHSSYLPNVFNKNFQAFNGIQNLAWGDIIKVSSDDTIYEYRVEKVYRARAQDVTVPIAGVGKKLTLATCNSFGTVDDRYVVEAKQISAQKL